MHSIFTNYNQSVWRENLEYFPRYDKWNKTRDAFEQIYEATVNKIREILCNFPKRNQPEVDKLILNKSVGELRTQKHTHISFGFLIICW